MCLTPLQLLSTVRWSHTEKWESRMHTGGGVCWQCAFHACWSYKLRHQQLQVPHPAQITGGQRQRQILWHLRAKFYRLVLKPLSFPEGKSCCTRYLCASVSLSLSNISQQGFGLNICIHIYIYTRKTHINIHICTHIHVFLYKIICISQSCLWLQ